MTRKTLPVVTALLKMQTARTVQPEPRFPELRDGSRGLCTGRQKAHEPIWGLWDQVWCDTGKQRATGLPSAKCLSSEILQCCVKWSTPQTLFPCQNPKITQCKNFSFVRTEPLSLVLITLADSLFLTSSASLLEALLTQLCPVEVKGSLVYQALERAQNITFLSP